MSEPTQADIERARKFARDWLNAGDGDAVDTLARAFAEVRAEERQRAEEALRDSIADASDEG
ncbi:MAG TPA: hypothetical protein VH020_09365 [Stellaceae bacterium]|jgi:hypothetical protein|nr:hypothetical protein [Stellaceae bacterium]